MKEYIRTGQRHYLKNFLKNIINNRIPDLTSQNLNDNWVGFSLHIMNNLATDFNLYMFFNEVMPNMPLKFLFNQFGEAVLDLCKLLDSRRNNKISLTYILNNIEQNITQKKLQEQFWNFKNDVTKWLNSKKEFLDSLLTFRDKFLAHIDIDENSQIEYKKAVRKLSTSEFIEVSNITIQIICEIITSIKPIHISEDHYIIDEFNFIYECLRSLDKIEKNVTIKNIIIHNIDLELQQIKDLIK